MAHVDWASSNDIEAMLDAVDNRRFEPQLRHFVVACARRVLQFVDQPEFSKALEYSDQFAENSAAESNLAECVDAADALAEPHIDVPTVRDLAASAIIDASSVYPCTKSKVMAALSCAAQAIAHNEAESATPAEYDAVFNDSFENETKVQCGLLRRFIETLDV